jgi:hypothetical protein
VFVDDGKGVGAVDLRMDDGLEMCGGVVFGPEAKEFEAGPSLGMVDHIEGFALTVVLDAQRMEVCLAGGEVEQLEWLRAGACRSVVIEVELALMLWTFENALAEVSVEEAPTQRLVDHHAFIFV